MKKMILGIVLFVCGFFGAIGLTCASILSPLNPWDYNGIQGFYGFVLGMKLQLPFILCIIIMAVGLALSIIEAIRTK